jgi:WhiB family transcriptional regulator, redox-sensing transcriptional regulator
MLAIGPVDIQPRTRDNTPLPPIVWDRELWRRLAACSGFDTNLFFPAGTSDQLTEQVNLAKSVCRSCPSRLACLEFSLRTLQDGIWGGHTEEERKSMRRKRRAAARKALVNKAHPPDLDAFAG